MDNLLRAIGSVASGYLAVKIALPAGALFLAFLLVTGALADPGEALADSCGGRGEPGVEAELPEGTHHDQQIANALIIDQVAADKNLPGRATLIALMTALQESSLLNLGRGDRDSLGLFQQRPSQGWGTAKQIQDPQYATTMFFMGGEGGDPPGLTDIPGWSTMLLGDAAQRVQRSLYPDLYAGQEPRARVIATEAGLDLERGGDGPAEPEDGPDGPVGCFPDQPAPGKAGEPFHDSSADWPDLVRNPRSTAAAIAWARSQARNGGKEWFGWCLKFVAQSYGWTASGVTDRAGTHAWAIEQYQIQAPRSMRHDNDRNPPPGALLYWDTNNKFGHVAIYVGGGKIASNDIARPGYIDIVDATAPETKWGAKYLGWAPPYFPNAG